MHAMGRKKGDRSYNSTDTTGDSSDDADLILSESSSGRTKKYVVSTDESQSLCTKKLSRNERLCLIIGGIVLAVVVLVFIIVAVAVNRKTGSTTGDEPWKNVRLPTNIVPSEYEVNLRVNLENFDVIGEVTVCAEVTAETSYILIHVKDMNVTVVQVSQGGSAVMIKSEFNFTENDFYVIELSTRLQTGPLEIRMTYNYTLRDDLVGFYRSSYVQSTGEKRWIATTQFEPTDARRAFPCFDEPGLKANFTIQITHDAQYKQVVSNMPVESSVPSSSDSNMVTTRFKTSVKMSTYLVAFIVSDFECVNGSTESGVMVRVCSNPEVINKTHYALEVATTVLGFYETFYGVPYPLEKQDLFAIPDFAAGAMENWGLITYRETALLYDSETNPASSRQRVAVVIAHELAHQWFGNLVTMAWWDGLWLNEGFATFVEYIGTNEAEPDFHMLDQFYTSDLSEALAEDGLNESHPIIQNVSDPDEINSLFDSISYSKGSSVIRMLQSYLTNTVFHNGIKLYLDTHKFANADTNQLWEALQEKVVPPKDYTVSEIMDTWTKQMGYPVVTFSKTTNTLTQTRFFVNGKPDVIASSPFNYIWIIPFDYTTDQSSSGEIVDSIVLSDNQTGLEWPATAEWVKADVGETGVYRVNYDTENWIALTQHLMDNPDSTLLPPVDRAGLLDDAFALSSAGLLDTVMALRLSWYLRNEREYVPWRAAINWIFTFAERLSLTPLFGNYQRFVLNLTRSAVNEFGFDRQNLTHLQTFLRTNLLATAWQFGHLEVISTARALFQEWRENGTIDPNLKDVVYQVGVAYGSEEDWDYMWEWYSTTDDPYEKRLCLRALAQSREPWILSRYLNYSVTKVRTQDTLTVVELVSENVIGRYLAWNFVRNNWHYFNEVYGGGSFSFSRLIRTITSAFSTELELKEVETFFGELPDLRSGTRATRQAIETIRGNVAWLEANLSLLDKCLENTEQCFT